MDYQLDHNTVKFERKNSNIIVLCDGVRSPANIGSIFRICEAFGVDKIIFCNTEINLTSNRLLRTARNTQKKVAYSTSENIIQEIDSLIIQNYSIIGVEISNNSIPIKKFQRKTDESVVVIIGNEQYGISQEVLNKLSHAVHIEMYGENSSMNVTHALSIALFSLT